jgi:8-oxo-dGTP pyrophosphatase MutT (NUDIX family)
MIYREKPQDFEAKLHVVACYLQYQDTFALLQRQPHKPYGSTWGLPAGKVNTGEDPMTAVIREVWEETGVTCDLEKLVSLDTLWVEHDGAKFVYHSFIAELEAEPTIMLSQDEHQDYCWVTPEESLSMNLIHDLDECNRIFFNL